MGIRLSEDAFGREIQKILEVKKINEGIGEKYIILNQKDKKEKLKGRIERYYMGDACELLIFKTKGLIKQKIYDLKEESEIFRIIYCIRGECRFRDNYNNLAKEYTINEGNMLIQRKKSKIGSYNFFGINLECLIVEIYMDRLYRNFLNIADKNKIENWETENIKIFNAEAYYSISVTKEIKNLLTEIQRISNSDNINKYIEFKSKILKIFFLILEQQNFYAEKNNLHNSETGLKIKKIIDESPIENMPAVKEICEMLSLSRYQLHIIFEKNEGIGIIEYIQRRKMEYSKKLLMETDKSILTVSIETGYENPSKFSRAFKKYFGILPSKYRMKMKEHKESTSIII